MCFLPAPDGEVYFILTFICKDTELNLFLFRHIVVEIVGNSEIIVEFGDAGGTAESKNRSGDKRTEAFGGKFTELHCIPFCNLK